MGGDCGITSGPCPRVIGHRANSARVTLLYKVRGIDRLEVDVSKAGGSLVAGHGPPRFRRPSLPGRIAGYVDYKLFSRDPIIAGRRPLRDWLSRLTWAREILLDLKSAANPSSLWEAVKASGYRGAVAISTHLHDVAMDAAETLPREVRVLATLQARIIRPHRYLDELGVDGASVPYWLESTGLIGELLDSGFTVYVWVVNDPSDIIGDVARADALISDSPWKIRRHCRSSM